MSHFRLFENIDFKYIDNNNDCSIKSSDKEMVNVKEENNANGRDITNEDDSSFVERIL